MANRNKGWAKLNRMKQMEANKSRGQIEKQVLEDGTFFKFNLLPAKRLKKGWNARNDRRRERLAIEEMARQKKMPRGDRRRATLARKPRRPAVAEGV